MQKIIITGGTGFIGLSLAAHLRCNGFEPILIARHAPKKLIDFQFAAWDGNSVGVWAKHLEGASAVVNLAGRSVDCIKTPENCDLILRSRVDSVRALASAFRQASNPPKVWVQMATAHIYGDPPEQRITESSTFGYGLAPFVGQAWEKALADNLPEGVREVRLRTSFVIGKNGGALGSLMRLVRLGLGGKAGSGRQGISWIHAYDMNEIIYQSIINENFNGTYIASAPNPVSNAEFMRDLRRAMKIPVGLPAPPWLTKLGARYIFHTDPELALCGRYVLPERLLNEGFYFKFPGLADALRDLV